jgi:hypothetical protein
MNARLLAQLGKWDRALEECEDAYPIHLHNFGPCRFEVEQVASFGVQVARELEDRDALEKWSYREIGLRARVAGTGEQESMLAKIENVESLPNHERAAAEDLLWRRIPELAEATPEGHERRARFYCNFGRAFLALGRVERARTLLRSAYAAVEYSDTRDEELPVIVKALATVAERRGDAAAAARWNALLDS